MHRIESRVRRLNALGFDVAELDITTDFAGSTIRIQPKVVDAGHHSPPADPADRPGHRGEPGAAAAQRPRLLPGADRPAGRGRVDRRPPVADRPVRAGGAVGARASCAASSSRPSSTTRCWSTAGSSARRPGRRCRSTEAADSYMRTVLRELARRGGRPVRDGGDARWRTRSTPPRASPTTTTDKPYDPWEDGRRGAARGGRPRWPASSTSPRSATARAKATLKADTSTRSGAAVCQTMATVRISAAASAARRPAGCSRR